MFHRILVAVLLLLISTYYLFAQTAKTAPPELLSPGSGEVLDNGCQDRTNGIVRTFEWTEVPQAQRYHLYVIGRNALNPVIDDANVESNYYFKASPKAYIIESNRRGWRCKVRALVNGVWTDWSSELVFDVEPLDADCRRGTSTPTHPVRNAETTLDRFDLTGKWKCNDGGTYYVRQIRNELWWYGQSADNGSSWTNVFHGRIEGKTILGDWTDIPQGRIQSSGALVLIINGLNSFTAQTKSGGGFGGSVWTR
ncbi:MAG TPA: hypothetical protein VF131_01940 [Blastocatellia bacterium]|nr:hypothetical protein [Blastocatellia bacterium]